MLLRAQRTASVENRHGRRCPSLFLVVVLRAAHGFSPGQFSGKLVRSVDKLRQALRANPLTTPLELQRNERHRCFCLRAIKTFFRFC